MKDINKVWVLGNLGNDAHCRPTRNNQPMTQLVIGTSSHDGAATEWHHVTLFGKPAHWASQLKKGARVLVEAHLQAYYHDDSRNGRRLRSVSLIGHHVETFGSGGARPQPGAQQAPGTWQGQYPQAQGYGYPPAQPAVGPAPMAEPAMMDPGFDSAGFADPNEPPPPPPNPGGNGWGAPGMPNGAPSGQYGYPGASSAGSVPPPAGNPPPYSQQPPRPAPSNVPTRRQAGRSRPAGNRNSFDQTPYSQE
ncbi:MAG TPA: single-stranded DNA-binding protein [Gammaproteobacteria bacterium]|nr:single-stranded DNA-binding protein [Gammaproteobacteria bacterium]